MAGGGCGAVTMRQSGQRKDVQFDDGVAVQCNPPQKCKRVLAVEEKRQIESLVLKVVECGALMG